MQLATGRTILFCLFHYEFRAFSFKKMSEQKYTYYHYCSLFSILCCSNISSIISVIKIIFLAAPPAMVVVPPAMATVNLWDNMQMMCVAYGNPLPSIIWSGPTCADITDKNCSVSDNVTVQSTTVGYGDLWFAQSVLQFCSIAEEGTYSCYASNGLTGTGLAAPSASISVTVIPPPEPPTGSTYLFGTCDAVRIITLCLLLCSSLLFL